mmetsp:Transcript_32732/g.29015  ORF Transcript_32732/g.29015 Transcript_32732/m.29015 type:complete len:95 (+) Transcript_32732:90-374(+)
MKTFPFFSTVQSDFDEILEGFSWKRIMKAQRKELALKISQIPEHSDNEIDITNRAILKEKLKFNPKYYGNDYNLLPHPIILELLDMVYSRWEHG